MNNKAFLSTLIASAVAIFGGTIGLMGVVKSPLALVAVTMILISTGGLIFISYNELQAIEYSEKQEEFERQQARDKIQREILQELKNLRNSGTGTRGVSDDPFTAREKYQREERLLNALERIAENIGSPDSPSSQRLEAPESQEIDNIPPKSDSAES